MNFNKRLSLLGYLRKQFGAYNIHKPASIQSYYKDLNQRTEGAAYGADGISQLCKVLQSHPRIGISNRLLRKYDTNITDHLAKINKNRQQKDRIVFKYFQLLAGFYTEYYLDRLTASKEDFLNDLNEFVAEQEEKHRSRVQYTSFEEDDLNKLAFWMATGSGKTLIMHLNYYQFLHYQPKMGEKPDNMLLITPNAGLTRQHAKELSMSGIPNQYYLDSGSGIDPKTVKLIEITKFVDDKTGEGDSIEVASFEANNLVFVDEGHKGSGTEGSKWMRRRKEIAENGFTFEYSATFGQAMHKATAGVQNEYGKAIVFDYSYPRFYEDGYGKDYRILNLKQKQTFEDGQQPVYLLANLLTFFEQQHIYRQHPNPFYKTWNLREPLLTFIGHSVQAGRTKNALKRLSDNNSDKKTISDVQNLILFLNTVMHDKEWTTGAIEQILSGNSGIDHENGRDLFEGSFSVLKKYYENHSEKLYSDLLSAVFHLEGPAPLKLANLTSVEGEIGLRAGNSDTFFGVINIGEDNKFLSYIKDNIPDLIVEEPNAFEDSLFQKINTRHSDVNILIGSRKFIEGWSSWRVSCMGLMNIGKSEGPQIIQLFGRGVRLLGKDRSLKRSSEMKGSKPANIEHLETLQIFGMNADYMQQFQKYLKEEGIDTGRRVDIDLDIKVEDNLEGKGLLVIRPKIEGEFKDVQSLVLNVDNEIMPKIDLTNKVEEEVSDDRVEEQAVAVNSDGKKYIPSKFLPLLDSHTLYREAWYYRNQKGYDNLSFTQSNVIAILKGELYKLYCDDSLFDITSFDDVEAIEQAALIIIRKYIDKYYKQKEQQWEYTQLEYESFDSEDQNIPCVDEQTSGYQLRVKEEAVEALEKEIKALFEDESEFNKTVKDRRDGKLPRIYFEKHLYLPLLIEDRNKDKVIESTPPGLNAGEWRFIRDLKDYFGEPKSDELFGNCETYVLRNQSRGHGIGFLLGGERFFPDFIVWVKNEEQQHICFIDPHGLHHGGDIFINPKVQFHKDIKEYEEQLNGKSGRDNIWLHSFIISETDFSEVKKLNKVETKSDCNDMGLYFAGEDNGHIDRIFRKVLDKEAEMSY